MEVYSARERAVYEHAGMLDTDNNPLILTTSILGVIMNGGSQDLHLLHQTVTLN